MKPSLTVALAGNPNSGKTTIFNRITGERRHVGNYPGVTVEKFEGSLSHNGVAVRVVDLPGTYSLTAYSREEVVARDFVVDERPDVVIDVVDSSNLERNLYLAVQFVELGVPLVLAFNMTDVARGRGYEVDAGMLSRLLNVPVVQTVGHKGEGISRLIDAAVEVGRSRKAPSPSDVRYGAEIEEEIGKIAALVEKNDTLLKRYTARWLALKLLENDSQVRAKVEENASNRDEIFRQVETSAAHIKAVCGDDPEIVIADRRYGFISGACQEAVAGSVEARHTMSDKIDAVLTSRVVGLPIFAALMFLMFKVVFVVGAPFVALFEHFFAWAATAAGGLIPAGMLNSLVVDGIIGGVGGVVVFVPNIMLLFAAIALLEDTGYMARAAFVMDHLMHKVGLHGKSFIPLLIGFGCNVPAIMAARTLESRRDRLTTMLITPLMSCSARLPIYILIIGAFFPASWSANMLFLMYVIGIALAMVAARFLRSTIFRGETTPLVMELPPYRAPTLKGLMLHSWERSWMYVRKAGTIILIASIIMWAATSFPAKKTFSKDYDSLISAAQKEGDAGKAAELANEKRAERMAHTVAGRVGRVMEPIIRPMGFDWRIGTALIGAFSAKEIFVSQMGIVYSLGETDERSEALRARLQADYAPLVGFCIMLFCLIGLPCMATVVVTWRESGSWRFALTQLVGLTVLAYVLTVLVFQAGSALGIGV